jgi:EAL domain-containing protein (putative c-di-GMP-specific phosphodiesterase class I)/CHASE2 domain-containing sensor protein
MLAPVAKANKRKSEPSPWKLLLWVAAIGLVFGLIGFGEIAEDWLRVGRNSLHKHPASGQIVVVKIDDAALRHYGNWPWPRRYDGALIDRLTAAGADQIYFDVNFSFPSNAPDDSAFAEAIARSGKVTMLVRSRVGRDGSSVRLDARPLAAFASHAKLAEATVHYNYANAVWQLPYGLTVSGRPMPSFASAISGRSGPSDAFFPVDYSIDVGTIPSYSAGDVLSGRVGRAQLAGKRVVVGIGSDILGDAFFIPGYGRNFGVFVHALGGETLKEGRPLDLGWFLGFLFAFGAAWLGLTRKQLTHRSAVFGFAAATLLCLPVYLESHLIFADITPGLFVLIAVTATLTWRWFRSRGLVSAVSGLPNLNALRTYRNGRKQALIAGRVLNYEEIVATLPADSERQLVEQIVARLKVGSPDRMLYQGDGGIFAWFEEPDVPFGNHLEALYALFRNPARVANRSFDLSIAFGVEVGSSRSIGNRLASALVAAEEAAHDGLKWKYHDPESLQDASWKLSILSQLDSAIDKGEVWVAYQPKLELETRRIIGAEALARWTHPEKGPIAASEFVAAAEQHDRIGKLTDFVLGKAVAAAASINKRGIDFDIAVNLSAKLLSDKGFTLRLAALLARHGLAAHHLTLELTETAALAGSGHALDMLARLRESGVRISIDDYGTGLSTLEYLKKVPADELKIDQSFVKGIIDNRSDRLMVQSTIGLAHSLGRMVVAEGVEQREMVDLLVEMKCDVAQGYAIGRPMSLESLTKRIAADRKRSAA